MGLKQSEKTEKLFYSISEVSEMFDLNASTIRFWEKEFDVLKPGKNKKGNRNFTKRDIDHIARIVDLVKQQGFTINGAKEQLKKRVSSTVENVTVIEKLQEIRSRLLALRDQL
jgi:DNA-binding transcriptional MerR regulator